jgi:hypothetical protein
MADKEPPRPSRFTGMNAPPPVKTKLTRVTLGMIELMKDPAAVEEIRKAAEEVWRDYENEQKLLEAADQEKAGSSARAGTRDHQKASEDNKTEAIFKEEKAIVQEEDGIIKEEEDAIVKEEDAIVKKEEDNDVGHGRNEPTEAQGLSIEPGSAFDLDVGILRCMDCRFDKTVSSHQAGYCYSSFTEHDEHHRSGYHSRKARVMRSFHLAKGRVVRNKAKCCGGFWTAEEFVGHLAEKHPDL